MRLTRLRGLVRPSRLPLVLAVVCGLLFTAELVPFARLWFDEHHDGLMLKNALDVYAGDIPYKDSYNQYGFLPSVLEAGLMSVIGRTLLTVKLAAVLACAFAAGSMVLLYRRAMPLLAALGAVVIWMVAQPEVSSSSLVFLPWPSYFALAFVIPATICHLRAFESERRSAAWAAAAGAFVVATMCCRFSVGALLVAALVGDHLIRWMRGTGLARALIAFLAGVLAAGAAVVLTMLGLGALGPMIDQTIIQPEAYFGNTGPARFFVDVLSPAALWLIIVAACCMALRRGLELVAVRHDERASLLLGRSLAVALPTAAILLTQTGWVVVPVADWWPAGVVPWQPGWDSWAAISVAAGLLALIIAAVAFGEALAGLLLGLRRVRPFTPPAATTIAIVGAAGIAQFYPVFEARHIYYSCVPALGLLVWATLRLAGPRPFAAIAVLLVVVGIPAAASLRGAIDKLDVPEGHLPSFAVLSGIVENPADETYAPLLVALKRAYAARPDAPMLNFTPDGLWGSLGSNMANPDAYFVDWPCPASQARDASFIGNDRPFIWWMSLYPAQLIQAYAASIGYRIAASTTPTIGWRWPTYLLLPGPSVPRPPYVWQHPTPAVPAPVWATVPAGSSAAPLPRGCPA